MAVADIENQRSDAIETASADIQNTDNENDVAVEPLKNASQNDQVPISSGCESDQEHTLNEKNIDSNPMECLDTSENVIDESAVQPTDNESYMNDIGSGLLPNNGRPTDTEVIGGIAENLQEVVNNVNECDGNVVQSTFNEGTAATNTSSSVTLGNGHVPDTIEKKFIIILFKQQSMKTM